MSKTEPGLAVALSGGGHRATLFTLGALLYLVDAGVNRQVTSIASVSGGSLTNALVGQSLNYRTSDGVDFRKEVAIPLASQIAKGGTFFAPLLTKAYVALLVMTGLLVFVPIFTDWAWYIRLAFFLAALATFGWIFAKRGLVCARAFETTLFSKNGKATLLRDTVKDGIDHILCATELRSSEAVFFSGSFVYSYCFGHGTPADLKLARAVQASACFPGGFPPARIPATPHQFADAPTVEGCAAGQRDELVMTDGGVYDNMGDEWARAFSGRVKTWPELGQDRFAPDRLVVVNASARFPWEPFSGGRIPIVGEIYALTSMLGVMYINTTNVRRQEMVHSFRPDMPPVPGQVPSALIQIAQSPFVVADGFAKGTDAAAARANAVRNLLGNSQDEWSRIADANKKVSTSLSRFDAEVSARLIYHGYVVSMCNLHVLFGNDFPLRPQMVDINQFRQLIR
jgi:hypothetical protein